MKKVLCVIFLFLLPVAVLALAGDAKEVFLNNFEGKQYKLTLNRAMPRAGACYTDQLKENPELKGEIKFKVTVKPDGKGDPVEVVSKTLENEKVVSCVKKILEKASWPDGEKAVFFTYTFIFEPKK